jgi:DNA-directed RNA polymerase specialized sigma24 family protein
MPSTILISAKSARKIRDDILKSWRQSVADRIGWQGGPRATAGQQPISVPDDSDGARIRAAFAQLPAEYQEVLTLQVRNGRSTTEIALKLNLTPVQVLSRLRCARRALRLRCGEDMQWDPEA